MSIGVTFAFNVLFTQYTCSLPFLNDLKQNEEEGRFCVYHVIRVLLKVFCNVDKYTFKLGPESFLAQHLLEVLQRVLE